MVETFCEGMRRECAAVWDAQLTHPFVVALADGTLPRETFQFYIMQDALFLTELAKTFAFAATKTNDRDRILRFGELLLDTIRVERALHEMYAAQFHALPAAVVTDPVRTRGEQFPVLLKPIEPQRREERKGRKEGECY